MATGSPEAAQSRPLGPCNPALGALGQESLFSSSRRFSPSRLSLLGVYERNMDAHAPLPPLRTTPAGQPALKRQVGFEAVKESPSSVLRAQDGASPASGRGQEPGQPMDAWSPLAQALRRERSAPQLPQLPKLKLGMRTSKGAGMQRSKSHGNLRQASEAAPVPTGAPSGSKSATSSPHAASSGGSEPVRIPFELSRRPQHRRTQSVDFALPPAAPAAAAGGTDEDAADAELSTSVISAASSLLGHHLGAGTGQGSPAGPASPSATTASGAPTRSMSAARDLYLAQADAVTAHAQVHSLQSALRREQDEVVRLRDQLQLMTAERDRLLAELALGGTEGAAPVFDMEAAGSHGRRAGSQQGHMTPPPRPRSALRTAFRLP